jgi:hypothetical protein
MTKLKVPVSYHPNVGYVTTSTAALTRTVTALSLTVLRKRVLVVAALNRRPNEPIAVVLELDPTARAEAERRAVSEV